MASAVPLDAPGKVEPKRRCHIRPQHAILGHHAPGKAGEHAERRAVAGVRVLVEKACHDLVQRVVRRPHLRLVVRVQPIQLVDAVCGDPPGELRRRGRDRDLASGQLRDQIRT